VLNRRMIHDKIEVRVLQRGLLDVFRIGQATEGLRLVRIPFMNTHQLHTALARLFIKEERVVVVELEASARLARIGVAIPLPGSEAVLGNLALHLFSQRRLGDGVRRLIPVVIWSEIALTKRPLGAGKRVEFVLGLAHQPAWQHSIPTGCPLLSLENLAGSVAIDFASRYARDNDNRRLAVKEHFFHEVLE